MGLTVDVSLAHDLDLRAELKAVSWADVLEGVHELVRTLVGLVPELVAGETKDDNLVAILLSKGIHLRYDGEQDGIGKVGDLRTQRAGTSI